MSTQPLRKLALHRPISWPHHRGGWQEVVRVVSERLHDPRGTRFLTAVEDQLYYHGAVLEPWVGFIHQVPRQSLGFPDLERLVTLPAWRASLPYCLGLWVLTNYQRETLRALGVKVPIALVRYPTLAPTELFSLDQFRAHRKVAFLGEFLRNYQAFYDLEAPGNDKRLYAYDGYEPKALGLRTNDSVTVERRVPSEAYDALLASHVVFLSLFDAGANTTVVECIASGTPILINEVGGVPEYLGQDYPLYYESLAEAGEKLRDLKLLARAHEYLLSLPIRRELTHDVFVERLQNTGPYRCLPVPERQRQRFRRRDLTVLICSYRRVDTLAEILRRFAAQDYGGWFEIVIWNNNADARAAVDAVVANAAQSLDVSAIHSDVNFYCGVRLAMPALMRSELLLICDDDVLPEPNYVSTFLRKHAEYGPDVVLCARGHEFLPHELDEDDPARTWRDGENLRFFDEHAPDRAVHFLHADNCLIRREILARAVAHPFEPAELVLVDDYWLSFVLWKKLGVRIQKIRLEGCFRFTPSAEDPDVAMFHSREVHEQRVNFYVRHMREGWPWEAGEEAAGA